MILVDAGPLVALIDAGEPDHDRCVAALSTLSGPMVTTWPAFTEAIYLLGAAAGWQGQVPLWTLVQRGTLAVADLTPAMVQRLPTLMAKYSDTPMDLADASLVAYAEANGLTRIVTLDSDFCAYRLPKGKHFTVIP